MPSSMLYLTDIDDRPQSHCIATAARHETTSPAHQNVYNTHSKDTENNTKVSKLFVLKAIQAS